MGTIVGADDTPMRGSGVASRAFGSDGMLLDPASGEYVQVDATGIAIWSLIDGERTVAGIVAELAAAAAADVDIVTADVTTFLAALADAGLISVRP